MTIQEILEVAASKVGLKLTDFDKVIMKEGHKPLINFVPKTKIIYVIGLKDARRV